MGNQHAPLVREYERYEKITAAELREEVEAIKKRLASLRETARGLRSEAYSDAYDDICRELAQPL